MNVNLNLFGSPFNPSHHGFLELHLRRRFRWSHRSPDGAVTVMHDSGIEELWGQFHLPLTVLALPGLRIQYLSTVLSSCDLDRAACDYAAPLLASFAANWARDCGTLGFNVVADMEVEEFIEDEEEDDMERALYEELVSQLMPMGLAMEGDDVVSTTRGASRFAIEQLAKEIYGSGEAGDADDNSDVCAVCLDEFLDGAEFTRLPCAHLFHYNCVVRWLEGHNSCPICRRTLIIS